MNKHRAAAAAVLVTVVLSACGKGGGQHGPPPLSVDVTAAKRQTISTTISLDGQIAPLEQSTLAFQQSGPILAVYVNVGDRVGAGEALAKIDDSTLRAQLSQAQAQAVSQSATAQGATIGLPVQQQQNNATLDTARAALANAKLVYDQNRQLYSQGYVSQATLENARAQYVQAQNAYENAQVGLKNNAVATQNVRASQASAVAAAANANTLQTQIGQTVLYAPYSGIITQRLADPGSFASPSQAVLAISKLDTVWINVNVPDDDLAYVHPGVPVTFSSSSIPGKSFQARITTVNAVPTQGTLSYLARIQLPNYGDLLRGGMLVSATLLKEQARDAVVVPRAAVAQTENGYSVYVVGDDNKAHEVPVRVGVQTDTQSQVIASQVQPGAKVITTRPDALKDGSAVAINGASPRPSGSAQPGGSQSQ